MVNKTIGEKKWEEKKLKRKQRFPMCMANRMGAGGAFKAKPNSLGSTAERFFFNARKLF